MSDQEDLIQKIKVLSDSIRKKSRDLKAGIQEREKYLETTFKPVVTPLKEISKRLETNFTKNKDSQTFLPIDQKTGNEEGNSTTGEDENTNSISEMEESEEEEEEDESERKDISDAIGSEEVIMDADKITGDSSENNISILANDIGKKGILTRKYILKMLQGPSMKRKYHVYGARVENNNIMIGDSVISIDESDNLTIRGKTYPGTPGLFELIFKASPTKYTTTDVNIFKKIVKTTSAHRKNYSALAPIYRNKSKKYEKIIAKLFPSRNAKSGHGISMKNVYETNIIYYNDVNKLVNRLRLLHEARQAGHTGVDNEIVALTQELRNQGYIE